MKLNNLVWTAVIALALAVLSVVSAFFNDLAYALAFGLASITSATLSARERK
jgi:hypothetical protein